MTSDSPKRATLAAVAICKNEERDIRGFLDHLLPWIDEVVVIDDGSTDRTLEILRAEGDRVTVIERSMDPVDGFAGQRNAGIDAARSDWLIHMDIDERVTTSSTARCGQAAGRPGTGHKLPDAGATASRTGSTRSV